MTRKILGLMTAVLVSTSMLLAQDDMSIIGDELTKDPEQNAQWREGQSPYPAKPKAMWELGLYGGLATIAGDVDGALGYNGGLTFRKSISYLLSIRFGGNYASYTGYDARAYDYKLFQGERTYQQNIATSPELAGYQGSVIHRNYETTVISANLELLVSVGNILFHKADPKWNAYFGAGLGYYNMESNVDLLTDRQSRVLYDFEGINNGTPPTTASDRKDARTAHKDLLDGDFETPAGINNTSPLFGDDSQSGLHGIFSLGITRRLGGRVNLGLEYQLMVTGNDLFDAYEGNRTSADILNQFNLRLGFNLGSKEKRVEPLYWVNPLNSTMNDVAELKQRPKFDLTDSDGDGVIDMIDQEKDSPAGCPVDTRGIILDSDGDGVPDCKDQEPYSPPGYTYSPEGVANVPTPITESDVRRIVDERPLPKTDWFLPMVHFDLDKYYIKPEFYGQLASVSQVAKSHPNMKLVVTGYSDNRGDADYNAVLAYNRAEAVVNALVNRMGVSRDRLIIQYDSSELIPGLPATHNTTYEEERGQYMNRRVEFAIAKGGETNATRPEGEAGSDTPGSSRPGGKYSGNTNSGY